jgi:gas vesicle protein
MADGYDRFENEGNGGGSFVMGLLTGTVLGAGLGMLFAPKAGSDLRNQISEQAGTLANQASEGVRKVTDSAGDWADRGRDLYGKAKDAVARGADEAQSYVRETANSMKDTGASGMGSTSAAGSTGTSGSSYGTGSAYGAGSDHLRGSSSEQTRGSDINPSTGSTGTSTGGSRRS